MRARGRKAEGKEMREGINERCGSRMREKESKRTEGAVLHGGREERAREKDGKREHTPGLMGSGARGSELGLLCIRWVLQWRAPGSKYIS